MVGGSPWPGWAASGVADVPRAEAGLGDDEAGGVPPVAAGVVSLPEVEVLPWPGVTDPRPGSAGCGLGASGIACWATVCCPACGCACAPSNNNPSDAANALLFN